MNARPSIPSLASATLFALLWCSHPFAFAQNGGDGQGVLTIEGEVTDSTCVVYFKEPSVSGVQTPSLNLDLDARLLFDKHHGQPLVALISL
jgi:type 1 fimbria pilin